MKVALACFVVQFAIDYAVPMINLLSFGWSLVLLSLSSSLSFYSYGSLIEFVLKPRIDVDSYTVRTVKVNKQQYPLPTIKGVALGELKSLVVNAIILVLASQRRHAYRDSARSVLWFFLAIASADLLFYWSHRSLHHGALYQIHKKHHEFRDTSSFVAGHKSFAEYCITTVTDIGAICLAGADLSQLIAWYVVGNLYNLEGHSSLSLLFMNSNFHDLHHTEFKENYGIYDLYDSMFGTLHKNTAYFKMPPTTTRRPFFQRRLSLPTSIAVSIAIELSVLSAMVYM